MLFIREAGYLMLKKDFQLKIVLLKKSRKIIGIVNEKDKNIWKLL